MPPPPNASAEKCRLGGQADLPLPPFAHGPGSHDPQPRGQSHTPPDLGGGEARKGGERGRSPGVGARMGSPWPRKAGRTASRIAASDSAVMSASSRRPSLANAHAARSRPPGEGLHWVVWSVGAFLSLPPRAREQGSMDVHHNLNSGSARVKRYLIFNSTPLQIDLKCQFWAKIHQKCQTCSEQHISVARIYLGTANNQSSVHLLGGTPA